MAGVMGGNRSMVEKWLAAAALAGEEMWQLPLPDRLKEQLKSEIADLKNSGDRWGGALTAGLFLNEFVGETPWVHVDIAGPSSAEKEHGHILKGATGFGAATIVEYMAGTRGEGRPCNLLPDDLHAVFLEDRVGGDDGKALGQGLGRRAGGRTGPGDGKAGRRLWPARGHSTGMITNPSRIFC